MNISVTRNPNPKSPPAGDYGFGQIFTPHMFVMDYSGGMWRGPRIVPYQNFSLDPAVKVLHYGQEIFEGMKAYKNGKDGSVHMFRPDKNVTRFNISCERMCMPKVDPELFMTALEQLIDLDPAELAHPDFARYFAGAKPLPGSEPSRAGNVPTPIRLSEASDALWRTVTTVLSRNFPLPWNFRTRGSRPSIYAQFTLRATAPGSRRRFPTKAGTRATPVCTRPRGIPFSASTMST